MAAAVTPLQTLSRRAGNYAPKAAPSPALLGDLGAGGALDAAGDLCSSDGTRSRRPGSRAGTARGGRAASGQLRRQGQLPFDGFGEMPVAPAQQEQVAEPKAADGPRAAGTSGERVLARETVVIRRRTVVVEKTGTRSEETAAGLRAGSKPTLRRIVLAELEDQDTNDAARSTGSTQQAGSLTKERVPAPKRDIPIVLEAVGTVAITALGMAALLFLG